VFTIAKESPVHHKEEVLIAENHKDPAGLLKTAAVRGSSPGLVMWDFVVDKVALG
jgi:hypothetical protein